MTSDMLDRGVLRELEESLGSAEELRRIIATFLKTTPGLLATLRHAATAADVPGVRLAAHTLKSSSAMLGAHALSARCEELERRCRIGNPPDVPADVAAIEVLYGAVRSALEAEAGSA